MEVRLLQSKKSLLPMLVTLSGMVYSPFLPPGYVMISDPPLERRTPSKDLYFELPEVTAIEVRLLQPEKANSLMLMTLSGMVIDVRLSQSPKAFIPMLVTLSGMVIEVRLSQ